MTESLDEWSARGRTDAHPREIEMARSVAAERLAEGADVWASSRAASAVIDVPHVVALATLAKHGYVSPQADDVLDEQELLDVMRDVVHQLETASPAERQKVCRTPHSRSA